jgi:hypothetical protein
MENIDDLREQIQEDICAFCDGMNDEVITQLCQIVVDNFAKYNLTREKF